MASQVVSNERDDAGQVVDPGLADDSELGRLEPMVPRRLYFLWEKQPWATGALDFEQDRRDWAALTADERTTLVKSIAPFFVAEERVARVLSPIILSADDDQEMAFLATQLVDEARHMQFFERAWREIFVPDPHPATSAVDNALSHCNDSFAELFDRRAMETVSRLIADPRDTAAKVRAVTIYHLIVEGTLGLTAMHFVLDYFGKRGLFPGFTEGLRNAKRDEHRHVAWGTWFLQRKVQENGDYGRIVEKTLTELLPVAASVFVEGGSALCDGLDPTEFLGYPSAQLNHFALIGLSRRLRVIGGATQEAQRFAASGAWRASRVL